MFRVNVPTVFVLAAALAVTGLAQLAPPAREIPLYPGPAPGSEKWTYSEKSAGTADRPQAQNIVRPVLVRPKYSRGAAVVSKQAAESLSTADCSTAACRGPSRKE